MTETEQSKFDYELATCNTFLSLYDKSIIFGRHGDPLMDEPDCICSHDLAIELVGIYDNEDQAKKLWREELVDSPHKNDFNIYSFENLYKNIKEKLVKLNDGLYDGFDGKIILLCDILSPYVKNSDIDKYIKSYIPFRGDGTFIRYFDEIWILYKLENSDEYIIKKLE